MTEREELEALFDMTSHPGWAIFIRDAEDRASACRDIETCPDLDHMRIRQGRLMELNLLLSYREQLREGLDAEDI